MAQKVSIVLVDDIDGSEATQTVVFGLDGSSYEIDLSDANATALRDALAPYVGHGRKVGRTARRSARAAASSSESGPSAREIREWAKANGRAVPERGRIPADVREAYVAAN